MRPDVHHLMCRRYSNYYFGIEILTFWIFAKLTTAVNRHQKCPEGHFIAEHHQVIPQCYVALREGKKKKKKASVFLSNSWKREYGGPEKLRCRRSRILIWRSKYLPCCLTKIIMLVPVISCSSIQSAQIGFLTDSDWNQNQVGVFSSCEKCIPLLRARPDHRRR